MSPLPRRATLVALALGLVLACDNSELPEAPQPATLQTCEGFAVETADEATDLRTGLRWDTFAELTFLTNEEATARCASRGKRLPTKDELLALRKDATDPCQLPACPFRGDRCATIQCGSAIAGADAHWGVAFLGGALVNVPNGQPEVALCVGDPVR